MQLNTMDNSGRLNNRTDRDSDIGDDLSHDDHSDDDMRDCDSVDGDHSIGRKRNMTLNKSGTSSMGDISFGGGVGGDNRRSPLQMAESQMSHHHQFPPNHPLNALGNFMGISGLHGIPNLQQHNDVLEKLKMQVRDMKMDQEYAAAHAAAFGTNMIPSSMGSPFTMPPTSVASFNHAAQTLAAQQQQQSIANMNNPNATNGLTNGNSSNIGSNSNFSFTSPTAPNTKEVNPASNSSTSSEASNSSQQNTGWSFEEQYKQVRQLYEINDDPKRKEFLDDLFSFMQKRGTPINRLPIMAKSVLDLYELYNLVIARGGLVDVINKKLWQEIIKGLHLPSSITSAAFTLRTQYMKYLYPYECEKKNLSTPAELQAAIDGNRREGRRSSYGQYETMHTQMQMPQITRQTLAGSMQQMSPLALVTHAAAANNQQAQAAAAAAAAAHHRLMTPTFGQVPNLVKHEIEQRMMEYLKLIQAKEEQNVMTAANGGGVGSAAGGSTGAVNGNGSLGAAATALAHSQQQAQSLQQQQQQSQQHRHRSQSPEISTRDALNALEMSRVALWQMYHNNTSPPASVNASPQGNVPGNGIETQHSEALNLSDSPPNLTTIKREREREPTPEPERDDFHHHEPPPPKRSIGNGLMPPGFPNFYLPHNIAAAANFHQQQHHNAAAQNDSDNEEHDDEDEDAATHNTTTNSSAHGDPHLNGHHHHHREDDDDEQANQRSHHHLTHHLSHHEQHTDRSDDSAIENSPTTSAGNGHISPVSTKKIHLSKQQHQINQQQQQEMSEKQQQQHHNSASKSKHKAIKEPAIGPLETLNLLAGLQFNVARNGTGSNGEQQLLVNLELNGIKYTGVLLANTTESDANEEQEPEQEQHEHQQQQYKSSIGSGRMNSTLTGSLRNKHKPVDCSKLAGATCLTNNENVAATNDIQNNIDAMDQEAVLHHHNLNKNGDGDDSKHTDDYDDEEVHEDSEDADEADENVNIDGRASNGHEQSIKNEITSTTNAITATAALVDMETAKVNAQITTATAGRGREGEGLGTIDTQDTQQLSNGTAASAAAAAAAAAVAAIQTLKDALITTTS